MSASNPGAPDLISRINDLYSQYAHLIDDDQLEHWPDLFTERAVYRVITRENYDRGLPLSLIYCDGRAMMADRISALRTANVFEPQVYCHILSAVRLVESKGASHHTRSNFAVLRTMQDGDTMVFACGRTFDTLIEDEGSLRFARRDVVLDSRSIDTLLVIPL